MWEVWVCNPHIDSTGAYYDAFKTREQAVACRDEYNRWLDMDETYTYIIYNTGD